MFFSTYLPLSNGKSEKHKQIIVIRIYDVNVHYSSSFMEDSVLKAMWEKEYSLYRRSNS